MAAPYIVIVDDDTWMADGYRQALVNSGYTVDYAANAFDAMALLDIRVPDALILDIFMPGPNGITLLHELQSHADLAVVPVVLVSNAAGDIPLGTLQPYGVVKILDKTTMHPSDIVAAIRGAL